VNERARKSPPGAVRGTFSTLAALVVASACTVPVVADVDDGEANRIVAALSGSGILADKAAEPGGTGRFRIEVPRDDATRAMSVLSEEGLPAERTRGVLDALGEHALVPSRTAEHERLLAGIAGDLERTFNGVDGVLSARVHLAVPRPDPLSSEAPVPATASVLIRHRGGHTPLGEADVRRFVSGAVPGLLPERVSVVDLAVPLPAPRNDLVRVGPASMTREAATKVRLVIAAAAFGNMFLVSCLVALWMRLRKLRPGLERTRAPAREIP
jgi:type III secretion protein J